MLGFQNNAHLGVSLLRTRVRALEKSKADGHASRRVSLDGTGSHESDVYAATEEDEQGVINGTDPAPSVVVVYSSETDPSIDAGLNVTESLDFEETVDIVTPFVASNTDYATISTDTERGEHGVVDGTDPSPVRSPTDEILNHDADTMVPFDASNKEYAAISTDAEGSGQGAINGAHPVPTVAAHTLETDSVSGNLRFAESVNTLEPVDASSTEHAARSMDAEEGEQVVINGAYPAPTVALETDTVDGARLNSDYVESVDTLEPVDASNTGYAARSTDAEGQQGVINGKDPARSTRWKQAQRLKKQRIWISWKVSTLWRQITRQQTALRHLKTQVWREFHPSSLVNGSRVMLTPA
jgi:hypothetical protein